MDRDAATEVEGVDEYTYIYDDEHTDVTVTTPAYITTDAEYVYGCIPEGRGNPSSTRKPDGVE